MPHEVDRSAYWQAVYDAEDTPGWDAGGPAPPLTEVLGRADLLAGSRRVVVPGMGTGHDAVRWAEAGHEVLGVDFAPAAIAAASARARAHGVEERCRFEALDVFEIGERYPGQFDVWLEYTCFCAIDPARRHGYARSAAAALAPGGLLIGLFYPDREDPGGPPFAVREAHLRAVFLADGSPFTLVDAYVPTTSIERRLGFERLWVLRRA